MLDDYKHLYEMSANIIPNWKTLDKNELCRRCVKYENDAVLYNAYLSAILYKYWNLIPKFHSKCGGIATPEMVYDWLVDSVSYALKHRRWEHPDSSIYNDPNGPDKVINRKMKCTRLNLYQFTNRKKRKDEFGMLSLDELSDKVNDSNYMLVDRTNNVSIIYLDVVNHINYLFNSGEYFLSYLLDALLHEDVFELDNDGISKFSERRMIRFIKSLDTPYAEYFQHTYHVDPREIKESFRYLKSLDTKILTCKIESGLYRLRHDKKMKSLLRK